MQSLPAKPRRRSVVAQATAAAGAKSDRAEWDALRKLLQWPADATAVAGLAPHYRNASLGDLYVKRDAGGTVFDVGSFRSHVATMPQQDGNLAFFTVDPVAFGFPFVRADKDGEHQLVIRDGQHEYVFDEVK